MSDARLKGNAAENRAAHFLLNLGYTIVTRRFKSKRGEIDLVAKDGETWVFVEVKSSDWGIETAVTQITRDKRERLEQAAAEFFLRYELPESSARFDVIAIAGDEVRHWPDAFG